MSYVKCTIPLNDIDPVLIRSLYNFFFFLAYKPDVAPARGRDAELQPGEEPAEGGGTEAGS